jgi:hypothetical protein
MKVKYGNEYAFVIAMIPVKQSKLNLLQAKLRQKAKSHEQFLIFALFSTPPPTSFLMAAAKPVGRGSSLF